MSVVHLRNIDTLLYQACEEFSDKGTLFQGYADQPTDLYKTLRDIIANNEYAVQALLDDNFTLVEYHLDDGYNAHNADWCKKDEEKDLWLQKIRLLDRKRKKQILLWDISRDSPIMYEPKTYKEVAEIIGVSTEKLRKLRKAAEAEIQEGDWITLIDEHWAIQPDDSSPYRYTLYNEKGGIVTEKNCAYLLSKCSPLTYKQIFIALRESGGVVNVRHAGKTKEWLVVEN